MLFSPHREEVTGRERKWLSGRRLDGAASYFHAPSTFFFSFLASLIFLKGFCKDGGTTNVFFFCLFHLFLFVSRKYALQKLC